MGITEVSPSFLTGGTYNVSLLSGLPWLMNASAIFFICVLYVIFTQLPEIETDPLKNTLWKSSVTEGSNESGHLGKEEQPSNNMS